MPRTNESGELKRALRDALAFIDPEAAKDYPLWERLAGSPSSAPIVLSNNDVDRIAQRVWEFMLWGTEAGAKFPEDGKRCA